MFDAKALLDQITRSVGQQGNAPGSSGGGGLMETLTGVLDQATQGLKDGANDSGLTNVANTAVTRVSGGQTPDDLVGKVKAIVAENQLATGAVLGGLGGLLLGTKSGRGLAGNAAKLELLLLLVDWPTRPTRITSQASPSR